MSPAPIQVTPEEIAASTRQWLSERWCKLWTIFPEAERQFFRDSRRIPVGDDILANIALKTLEWAVKVDEREITGHRYLVQKMNWLLLNYLKDHPKVAQFSEFELEKGFAS